MSEELKPLTSDQMLESVRVEHDAFLTAYPAFRGKLSRSDKATHDAWFRVWYVRATIAKQTETEWQEALDNVEPLKIDYTNYRGERATRLIIPKRIYFGVTEYHPTPQWLIEADDLNKGARTFAVNGIYSFSAEPVPQPEIG